MVAVASSNQPIYPLDLPIVSARVISPTDRNNEVTPQAIAVPINTPSRIPAINVLPGNIQSMESITYRRVQEMCQIVGPCSRPGQLKLRRILQSGVVTADTLCPNGNTPLYTSATFEKSYECTKILLEEHASPNLVSSNSQPFSTPLLISIYNGNAESVELLLSFNADRDFGPHGVTPSNTVMSLQVDTTTKQTIHSLLSAHY